METATEAPPKVKPDLETLLKNASTLCALGIYPIPIPRDYKTGLPLKGPVVKDWQKQRLKESDLPSALKAGMNLGMLLGKPSGNLIQADFDHKLARQLAKSYFPLTELAVRRDSVGDCSYFYRLSDEHGLSQEQYNDPDRDPGDKRMLLELRGNGHQAMVAPSVHPDTGESVAWASPTGLPSEPAVLTHKQLRRAAGLLAAATLLGKYWVKDFRNSLAFNLSGWLVRSGWEEEEIIRFVIPIAIATNDETNRESEIRRTCRKYRDGSAAVAGKSEVVKIIGPSAAKEIEAWLGLSENPGHPPSSADLEGTDIGNAEEFAAGYSNRAHFSPGFGWAPWDGRRWRINNEAGVIEIAKEFLRSLISKAAIEPDRYLQKRLLDRAKALGAAKRIEAMLRMAKSDPRIYREGSAFNRDRLLFNVLNGTLELSREGQLQGIRCREHRPDDLNTKLASVEFNPAAPWPKWRKFLERILPDEEVREYLRRAIGYSLTGDVSEQCLFVLYGTGANGKTTLLNVLLRLFGDYGLKSTFEAFLLKRSAGQISNDIARLAGARLVVATEGPEKQELNASVIKDLTGTDRITARFLYHEFFQFDFEGKIFLATNYRPRIDDPSDGMWRRIKLIPFEIQIPKKEQNKHLLDELLQELPGIFNWALDGCLAWQEHGLGEPEPVTEATADYRSESDFLEEFIKECCIQGENLRIPARVLYQEFSDWTGQRWPLSRTVFNARMRVRFRSTRPQNVLTWHGIGLRSDRDGDM